MHIILHQSTSGWYGFTAACFRLVSPNMCSTHAKQNQENGPSHLYRGIMSLSWSDIELSWKLHLPEHLLWILTYLNGNVGTL